MIDVSNAVKTLKGLYPKLDDASLMKVKDAFRSEIQDINRILEERKDAARLLEQCP